MTISINIKELTFQYGSETILDGISINIKPESFISIIGPNGSGKSTLLKNISAILKPSEGMIYLEEHNISHLSAREIARKMAVVPQETIMEYRFSAFDIVLMGRSPHIQRFQSESFEDYKIAKNSMEATDTWRFKDRFINELSGGERQRVIIARALTQEPKIILLDEPTAFLDIQHQMEILELLCKLNRENGLTVVVVLHDINLAARFSNYMLLLKEGRVIAEGTPEEVITNEIIKQSYGIEVVIKKNPFAGTPYVIPITGVKNNKTIKNIRVHVICGGGTGGTLIQKLVEEGYEISTGVLNIGDSDWELSKLLDINIIEEAPFVGISDEIHKKHLSMIDDSNVIILSSIPLGYGNLKNLEAVEYAIDKGKTVLFLNQYNEAKPYDYTKGLGRNMLTKLEQKGIVVSRIINDIVIKLSEL